MTDQRLTKALQNIRSAINMCPQRVQGQFTKSYKFIEKTLSLHKERRNSEQQSINSMRRATPTSSGYLDIEKEVRELIHDIENGKDFRKSYRYNELKRELGIY